MAIDILNIAPNVVSRDLRGKYVLLYGKPKSGKTTAACSFPKVLLCAFEKGYNMIGGVHAQDINKWTDFKTVVKQLAKPEAKQYYETVIIDTITIAWDMCEKHICSQHDVQKIGDIPWGGGYSECKKEFAETLRQITKLGYGIVLIAHDAVRIEKDKEGNDVECRTPELPKRAVEVCNGLVDIIGYIGEVFNEDGESERYLFTRETPTIFAGSRFKYLPPKIKFGYDELVKAINEAIDEQEKVDGITVVDRKEEKEEETLDFNTLRTEARQLWETLTGTDNEELNEDMAIRVGKKIENIFGRSIRLSEISENQLDLFDAVVTEMRALVDEMNK